MKKVILVTCGSKKKPGNHPAKELYVGPYFRACMDYAESLKPDQIFILSAKHHLLPPNTKVDCYDETLNEMGVKKRREWAAAALGQIKKRFGNEKVEYTILAGARYWEFLVDELVNVRLPLKGKKIGKQLQFLGRNT